MREGKNALLMAQDWPIVQGLGQLLSLTRCCISCVPEVTPAVPYNGALESKLCIVPGLPGNAVYLVLEPVVWLSTGQLVPQPLLRTTWFVYKQYVCLKNTNPMETTHSQK